MTQEIADKIKELNGGETVSAVFIVGGGGKLPIFAEMLAKKLEISKQRCALRGEEVLKEVDYQIDNPNMDSMFVTPIGICLNFYDSKNNFIFVNFNGERVKLYDNGHLLVVDAAIQAGFPNEELFPRRGAALNFTLNGTPHMIRGELGEAAIVTVNEEEVSINSALRAGDKIVVTSSTAGAAAYAEINQLSEYEATLTVQVNGTNVSLPKYADVNGELQSGYYAIKENDYIKLLDYYTVGQIVDFMDVKLKENMNIYVNNKQADLDTQVYSNFSLIWTLETLALSDVERDAEPKTYADLPDDDAVEDEIVNEVAEDSDYADTAAGEEASQEEAVDENNEASNEDVSNTTDLESKEVLMSITVMVNNRPVHLKGKKDYIFVDVFDYIDFDLSKPEGRAVVTRLNGQSAVYTALLKEGDKLDIYWEN